MLGSDDFDLFKKMESTEVEMEASLNTSHILYKAYFLFLRHPW